ncbi:hypothetical protein RHSIM_RhsimUnG0083400 [Rhododendron simsii]|uniref:Protein kinase domain-containing protein n=1 Tax=Rhododendron simsii TaxID=118357 RepID=A0A834L579_RHOSS|nr:hypothetical protein RHSIM_RhsimUnG0083400 [Rhododendron simsii]
MFLTDASVVDHPNLVNVIGYCCDEQVRGVVYDLDPVDTTNNMILKGTIDLCSGSLKPFRKRWNVGVAVVVNIELLETLDFVERYASAMEAKASDGPARPLPPLNLCILLSLCFLRCLLNSWTARQHDLSYDVFSYGVILIELIAKIAIDLEKSVKLMDLPDEQAKLVYKPGFSLVQESSEKDPGYDATDGPMITNLAMCCVEYYPENHPTLKEVVEQPERLRVVKLHGDGLGPSN